jgi:hypothetical protein
MYHYHQKLDSGPTREKLEDFENWLSLAPFATLLKVGHFVWQ